MATMGTYAGLMDTLGSDDIAVWHACKAIGTTVIQRISADLTSATGLSGADWGVISRLEDLGGGRLGQQELTLSMGLTKGAMSNQLSRMVARALVQREKESGSVTVVLTDHGRSLLQQARPIHARAVRTHLLDRLSPDERDTLVRIAALISA